MNVGSMDLSASHNIEQIVEVMDDSSKQARLFGLLETLIEEPDAKILVFVETKRKCDELTYLMKRTFLIILFYFSFQVRAGL
jgi:ATP-dependent RNA helicase DDX5/DBP2